MKWIIFVFFIAISAFGQQPVKMVFDSIKSETLESRRKFQLYYHISNTSAKAVSFFLNTKAIVPVISSSMSYAPHYKLYKDGKSVDVSGTFTWAERTWESPKAYQNYIDSIRSLKAETLKKGQSDRIMASLIRLEPGESKFCSIDLYWNFERYQKYGDHEYYLDAESEYTLELSMHLLLPELKNRLEESAYDKVSADQTMITGWFTSNTLRIDLSDK